MISCITLVRKKPEMSMDEFKENWVKLADKYVQLPTIHGYEQNYVFKKDKGDASCDKMTAEGFSIERYADLADYEVAANSPEYKAILEERKAFIDYTQTYVCLEHNSIPYTGDGKCQKKITALGRTAPEVSFEDFTREWFVFHTVCMRKLPSDIFLGYNQHLILEAKINDEPVKHSQLPLDGILELFQTSAEEVANVFATNPDGMATVAHRKEFMSRVNPFQVTCTVFK